MFLEAILADKRTEVAQREVVLPLGDVQRLAEAASAPRDFLGALRQPGLSVIAEIKRGSPSRGAIRPGLDAAALAAQYAAGGCAALSILTDSPHFGAHAGDLPRAREAVSVPVLRKDFIISEYQVWESRSMGADAILLIVAALGTTDLRRMMALAAQLGMSALVEVHDESEVEAAVAAGAAIVGINNRDLHSFHVDVETTSRLRPLVPPGTVVVSESGISGPAEIASVRGCGVDAVLIGEALVCSGDPAGLIQSMRS